MMHMQTEWMDGSRKKPNHGYSGADQWHCTSPDTSRKGNLRLPLHRQGSGILSRSMKAGIAQTVAAALVRMARGTGVVDAVGRGIIGRCRAA